MKRMCKNNRIVFESFIVVTLLGLLLSGGCQGTSQPGEGELKGTLTVSGAWALYPMVVRWGEEFQAQHPDVQFDISAGGAGKGMVDVLGGAVDIGMVSREVHAEEIDQGAWWVAVTMDAVVPTMNGDNPHLARVQAQGLTRGMLEAIWLGQIKTWGEVLGDPTVTDEIHVYTRSDACGAAETWAVYLGDYKQEDLQGVAVYGDPGLATAVSDDPLGVGYNNLNFAYDADTGRPVAKIQIMPIDRDENGQVDAGESFYETKTDLTAAIADGRYPAPPARALYLVTLGAPDGLTKAFIEWALTDGQAFVDETGYIQLSQAQLQEGLDKLKAGGE
jgi:phosphate transport system substrate-binding protein